MKRLIFVLTLCLVMISASLSFAACPNVVGDWDFTVRSAFYNPVTDTYGYETHKGIFHIKNQNGCLFYGYREIPDSPASGSPLTGAISTSQGAIAITITAGDRILLGTLGGYAQTKGLYTRIKYSRSNLGVTDSDIQKTGLGTAIRR